MKTNDFPYNPITGDLGSGNNRHRDYHWITDAVLSILCKKALGSELSQEDIDTLEKYDTNMQHTKKRK